MIILIHVLIDSKYLLWGPRKKFILESLYEVIVSTANPMMYPYKKLSTQKSKSLEIELLTLVISWTNWSFHLTGSLLRNVGCPVTNLENNSYTIIGNTAKNISWISDYMYISTHFFALHHDPVLSSCMNANILESIQSSISFFFQCHNIYLNSIN